MKVISLLVIFCRLAFSSEADDVDLRHVEKCNGVCVKQDTCGMPPEIAKIYTERRPAERQQRPHYQRHPGWGYQEGDNEAGDKSNRRLLDTTEKAKVCHDDPQHFDTECKKRPRCGSLSQPVFGEMTCPQIAAAGLCNQKKIYGEVCCKSCAVEKLAGCADQLKNGSPLCTSNDRSDIDADPSICNDMSKLLDETHTANRCPKYCWETLGRFEWCLSTLQETGKYTCIDDHYALDRHCGHAGQAICGYQQGTITSCNIAAERGWCVGKGPRAKWMQKTCKVACGTCPTCKTYKCPETYEPKKSAEDLTTVSKEVCCVSAKDLCSCSWECMFTDSCCDDFSTECCKE